MADITVIMPLFNAEKYLEECLDSVLEQSFSDFELVCVDDASDDYTLSILKKYSTKDSRIKIICNNIRMGAAVSRNKALREAKGKYLTFLDGDDIFDKDMLKTAYETAEKYSADVVEYQYKIVNSESIYTKATIGHSKSYREKFCQRTFKIQEIKPYEFMNCSTGPCNKLFRRDYIAGEQLEFQNLSSCNDGYFVNMALYLASKIIYTDDTRVMLYVRQHNTPSRISYDRDPMNAYLADKKIAEKLVEKGKMEEVYRHYYYRTYCHLVETLKNTRNEKKAKNFYSFLQKEGIETLRDLGGKYYIQLDQAMKNRFERFEKNSFETNWYNEEGEFRDYLEDNLPVIKQLFSKPGIRVIPSQANYIMIEVMDNKTSRELTKTLLLKYNLFVKDLKGKLEDKNCLRVAVRNRIDNDKLIAALKKEME